MKSLDKGSQIDNPNNPELVHGKSISGTELIAEERKRQIEQEGWSAEHDKQHTMGELALVAALYATPIPLFREKKICDGIAFVDPWPWFNIVPQTRYSNDDSNQMVKAWDKRDKHDRMKKLVIAGALIAAEIDRLRKMDEDRLSVETVKSWSEIY